MKLAEIYDSFRIFTGFLKFLRGHRKKLVFLCGVSVLSTLAGVVSPLVLKMLVDDAVPHKNWNLFWIIALGYCGISLFLQAIGLFQGYISLRMDQSVRSRLTASYMARLLRSPYGRIRTMQEGAHLYRAVSDVGNVSSLITSFFIDVFGTAISLVTAVVIMVRMDWQITLIFLAYIPLAMGARLWTSFKLRPIQKELRDDSELLNSDLGEIFSIVKLIKTSGSETREVGRYLRSLRRNIKLRFRLWRKETALNQVRSALESGPSIFLQWWIWFSVMRGVTSLGTAMAIAWYFSMVVRPFMQAVASVQRLIAGSISCERLKEILEAPSENLHSGLHCASTGGLRRVAMRGVSFAYKQDQPVLHDVSCELRRGRMVVVMGPSGSGKTTLASLLCGLYSPDSGEILADGQPLRSLSLASFRKQICVIPQECTVIHGSVMDNILYGSRHRSRDDAVRAAMSARIHDRILRLPEGYDTELCPGDKELSSGEKQRLQIARAFAKNGGMMIFDEPCANLDPDNARQVMDAIRLYARDRIILLITHHRENIQDNDELWIMDNGRLKTGVSPDFSVHSDEENPGLLEIADGYGAT